MIQIINIYLYLIYDYGKVYIYSYDGLLLLFLAILPKKLMINQLLYRGPIIRILRQTLMQKRSHLLTHIQIRWNLYLVFYYLYQLLLSSYLEWIITYHHLVHHYAYWPYIYFLVVLSTFEDLGAYVERGAAKCASEGVIAMHWPPEIT